MIAERLLLRAEALRKHGMTVPDFIHGALLAVEATEMLGGRTPTSTLSGISLQHDLEVKAGCSFVGAGYQMSTKRLLAEIDAEIQAMCRWFHPNVRNKAALDSKVSMLNRLVLTFRESGRIEEELACQTVLRAALRRLNRPKGAYPFSWAAHGLLVYAEWLLGSFDRVILMTVLWVLALAGTAWLASGMAPETTLEATTKAMSWFFGGNTESSAHIGVMLVSWCAAVAGAFHVGVFISYLYSLVTRK